MSYEKDLFERYKVLVDEERMMRREVYDAIFNNPKEALKAGIIGFKFNIPTPSGHFRNEVISVLEKEFIGDKK